MKKCQGRFPGGGNSEFPGGEFPPPGYMPRINTDFYFRLNTGVYLLLLAPVVDYNNYLYSCSVCSWMEQNTFINKPVGYFSSKINYVVLHRFGPEYFSQ